MPRLLGVDIPGNKNIKYSLTYIKGIGESTAEDIIEALEIDPNMKADDLSEEDVSRIANHIDQEYVVEGELERTVKDNIKHYIDIGTYRGKRHRSNLPVRGQRTQKNARTRKGPKRTVSGISVRKAVSKT